MALVIIAVLLGGVGRIVARTDSGEMMICECDGDMDAMRRNAINAINAAMNLGFIVSYFAILCATLATTSYRVRALRHRNNPVDTNRSNHARMFPS